MKTTQHQTIAQLRQYAARATAHARQAEAAAQAIRADPRIAAANLRAVLSDHAAKARTERQPVFDAARANLAQFREDNILKMSPDFRPASAADASYVAAKLANVTALSPRIGARELKNEAARGNLAFVSAYLPI